MTSVTGPSSSTGTTGLADGDVSSLYHRVCLGCCGPMKECDQNFPGLFFCTELRIANYPSTFKVKGKGIAETSNVVILVWHVSRSYLYKDSWTIVKKRPKNDSAVGALLFETGTVVVSDFF